jgi:hypothetical protein
MNINEFKVELIKSYNQILKIGVILLLMCGSISSAIIIFGDFSQNTTIAGLSIFGLFVLIGLGMMTSSLLIKRKIKTDTHELLIAIKNKENLLIWIFEHVMTTQHELSNKKHNNHIVTAYKKDGKIFRFMLKQESQVQEMITFLSSQFPHALIGYSEENRIETGKVLGTEIKQSMF